MLTSQALYELRVDMTDFDGESRFAKYKVFNVGNRDTKFRLSVGGYSGTAGELFWLIAANRGLYTGADGVGLYEVSAKQASRFTLHPHS